MSVLSSVLASTTILSGVPVDASSPWLFVSVKPFHPTNIY